MFRSKFEQKVSTLLGVLNVTFQKHRFFSAGGRRGTVAISCARTQSLTIWNVEPYMLDACLGKELKVSICFHTVLPFRIGMHTSSVFEAELLDSQLYQVSCLAQPKMEKSKAN